MMLRFLSLFNRPPRGFMQMVPDYQMPIPYDAAKLSALIGKPSVTGYEAAIDQTLDWISATSVTAPR